MSIYFKIIYKYTLMHILADCHLELPLIMQHQQKNNVDKNESKLTALDSFKMIYYLTDHSVFLLHNFVLHIIV